MNRRLDTASQGMKPRDRRPAWQWIEENVVLKNSPLGDKPRFDLTPWLKEPSEEFSNHHRKEFTLQCCVQGGKTFFLTAHVAYALCEDPGPIIYYVQTGDFVKKFAEAKMEPIISGTKPLEQFMRKDDRFANRKTEWNFAHTFFYCLPANESEAQGHTVRYVFEDDLFLWPPGMQLECDKRVTRWWNKRIVRGSTAGDLDSDIDLCWRSGDQREWQLACPECGWLQIPDLDKHLKWTTDEKTKPDGNWNFHEVKKTVRFQCEKCGQQFPGTDPVLRKMNAGGKYIVTNPQAPEDKISFRWNCLCLSPSEFSWGDLVEEFLKATRAWKAGYQKPMHELKTKRLAISYDPTSIGTFDKLPSIDIRSPAKDEVLTVDGIEYPHIIAGVDVQADHFWMLVEAWSGRGDSISLWAGQLDTWQDVAEKADEFKVPFQNVAVDVSHRGHEVVVECCKHGKVESKSGKRVFVCWKALRGSERLDFVYVMQKGRDKGKRILLPYSWPPNYGDPTAGKSRRDPRSKELRGRRCQIISWSNPTIKDVVIARRDGKAKNIRSTIAKADWNDALSRHLHSQKKVVVQSKYSAARWKWESFGPDHLLDCKCMITVRAFMLRILGDAAPDE